VRRTRGSFTFTSAWQPELVPSGDEDEIAYGTQLLNTYDDKLLKNFGLAFATTNCGETSGRDPIWSPIRPHAQHPIVDGWMVHLLHICDALPLVIHSPQPDVVNIEYSVMMDIEITNRWRDISGRGVNVASGRGGVPRSYARRSR
jgi:hypothetical protein